MGASKTTKTIKGKGKGSKATPKKETPVIEYVQTTHVNNAEFSDTRPGLLAWLYRKLYLASPKRGGNGVTKAELLAEAITIESFTSRYSDVEIAREKMKTTISAQVPSQFKSERGYILKRIEGDDKRFYLDEIESERYIASLPDSDNRTKRPLPWAITGEIESERPLTSRVPTQGDKK